MGLSPNAEVFWAILQSPDFEDGAKTVNIPGDPGGVTKWGFAQNYNQDINVLDLTEDQAKERFRTHYWDAVRADELPKELAFAMADSAFHQGPPVAIKQLQRALGIKVDGIMGVETMQAVSRLDPHHTAMSALGRRIEAYANSSSPFKIGFYNRVAKLAYSLGRL
jgi:lysozyme family protein